MIKKLFVLILLLQSSASFANINFQDINLKSAKQLAEKENKLIFLDFYTDWCVPCKKMDAEVLSKDTVADYFNAHFISIKANAERGYGLTLKSKFGVHAYPTYVFLDAAGEIVDFFVGGRNWQTFLKRARDLENKETFLNVLDERYRSGDRSTEFLLRYFTRFKECEQPVDKQIKAYWAGQSAGSLSQPGNWMLIQKCMNDTDSDQFKYVEEHQAEFIEKYGRKAVMKYFEASYYNSFWMAFRQDNPKKSKKLAATLQNSDYEFKQSLLERISRFKRTTTISGAPR